MHLSTDAVKALGDIIDPFANLIRPRSIGWLRYWRPVLTHYQPQQADRSQHRRYGVVTHTGAQVVQECRAVVLHHAPRLINHLAGGEFAFQPIDDVANTGPLSIDLALDLFGAFFRFDLQFAFHVTFLRSAS
ncbi:hypothetical protein D3C87_1041630 [compost metagenome]